MFKNMWWRIRIWWHGRCYNIRWDSEGNQIDTDFTNDEYLAHWAENKKTKATKVKADGKIVKADSIEIDF